MRALLEHEARLALEEYGIRNVPGTFCDSKDRLAEAAEKVGYPLVMKVVSPEVVHKSDSGGVKINIGSDEELLRAYDEMMQSVKAHVPAANIHGVLLTSFVKKARELIVGAVDDSQFGPVVMIGLGGIFVEVYKDISFGIAPVTKKEARNMLESIRSFPILNGVRGEKPVNVDAVCDLIVNVSNFAYEKGVKELDLNPVFCVDDKVLVGDVRILLKGEHETWNQ